MGMIIVKIFLSIFAIAFGVFAFIKTLNKHQKIDTESIAVVKDVQDLGRDDGRHVYAIRYNVQAKDPFELLVTPCKKALRPGVERSVFYEKADPKKNYYFKTIGQLDMRFVMPCVVTLLGLCLAISIIISFF